MIRLSVRCRADQGEAVLAELLQLAPNGVEEEELSGGLVEYSVYGAEGELPDLGAVEAAAGEALVAVRSEPVPDDWADRWRDFHEPTLVAGRILVRPSWRSAPEGTPAGATEVVIDPGQAFGTGAHPTTRMCLELLLTLADRGEARGALADLGTGSAILAIAAAKLGWAPVLGVDLERAALEAATANAAANGVELDLVRRNLRAEAPPATPALVANLTAPLLREVAPRVAAGTRAVVCSGLLAREAEAVRESFADSGLRPRASLEQGDWTALLLER